MCHTPFFAGALTLSDVGPGLHTLSFIGGNKMSIRNLQYASIRRYVEEEVTRRTVRIFAEERPKYEQWAKDAGQLLGLWVTETDSAGERHIDRNRPDLDPEPLFKLQFTPNLGARVWLNVCIADEAEYKRTLSEARAEAAYILEQKARWKDFNAKSEMTGRIDEVVPEPLRAIVSKYN